MIADLEQIKAQLSWSDDLGTEDDDLLTLKLRAAQNHVERILGYKIEEAFGGEDQDEIPPALIEAVLQLAAHWFENREAAGEAVGGILFGVEEIAREYREFTF
jgi:Phage QLRG family, putative DNA packaging.